ncbi:MAG: nucleotidyltransferase domain-containing protein [Calditrichaeota bacterium]|nr:nucleotidyltransferase domain-containing protein [Calditrichota bacterium]
MATDFSTHQSDTRTRADIEPILREVVDILVREYQPELIILYGSYAYGNPTRHSDIDLLIVKETKEDDLMRFVTVKTLIYKPGRDISIQPEVFAPSELEERLSLKDPFIRLVLNKGEKLYERVRHYEPVAVRLV